MSSLAKLLRAPLAVSLWISIFVSFAIVGLRSFGSLESLELAAYDWIIRMRPNDPPADPRIALVTITEQDIQNLGTWPLPDDVLAEALESILRSEPRAVGGEDRCLLVRGGRAFQLTKDQSLTQRLVDAGELTEEEAEASARRDHRAAFDLLARGQHADGNW